MDFKVLRVTGSFRHIRVTVSLYEFDLPDMQMKFHPIRQDASRITEYRCAVMVSAPPETRNPDALTEDREMCENQIPREVPVAPVKGGWGGLVSPGDTLANAVQKDFRSWLASSLSLHE